MPDIFCSYARSNMAGANFQSEVFARDGITALRQAIREADRWPQRRRALIKTIPRPRLVGAISLCWMCTEPAFADDREELSAEPVPLIVTAQRRNQEIADVPSSVVVLGADTLSVSGVENLNQVGGLVPGLVISPPTGFNSAVYIRGVGADSRNIGFDTRVGVYVDGIYAGQSPAIGQSLLDIQRVEVMRGPQGTFFGKNSIAGAVNIVTRPPTDTLDASASFRAGNMSSLLMTGSVNIPITDGLATRIAANRFRRDGWVKNLYDGTELGNAKEDSQRAQVRIELPTGLAANVSIDHLRSRSHAYYADNLTDTFGTRADTVTPGSHESMLSTTPHEEREIFGMTLALRYEFAGGSQLVATSSYKRTALTTIFDEDWSSAEWFSADYRDRYRDHAQEFQLVSPNDAPIRFLAGLYYQHQNNFTDRRVLAGSEIAQLPFGIASGARVGNSGTIKANSFAVYVNLTTSFAAAWELDAGLRYSHDRKRVDWQTNGAEMPAFNLATGRLVDKTAEHDVSPSLSVSFRPAPTAKLYLRYAEGYKSGGFNLDFVSADVFPGQVHFNKETVRSYEAGMKLEQPNIPANFEIAAFIARYTNYQVNQFQDLGGGRAALTIANAASVQTKGIEADLSLHPLTGLAVSVGTAVLDGKFLRFPGGGVAGADVSGNRLPYASKFYASTAIDYDGEQAWVGSTYPFVHVDISYRSAFFATVDNVRVQPLPSGGAVPYGHADGYALVNVAAGMRWRRPELQLSLWARNLFGSENTIWMLRDFLGTIVNRRHEPRTFGVETKLQF